MKPLLASIILLVGLSFVQAQSYVAIPDSLKYSSNAVILNQEQHTELTSQESYTTHYKRKVTVLNEKGSDFLNLYIHYTDGRDVIKNITCSIQDSDGDVIYTMKRKEVSDVAAGDGYSIISDGRFKHWSYETNNYPVTIEYSYTKTSSDTWFLPSWRPIPYYDVAVVRSIYQVSSNQELRSYEQNMEQYPSITQLNGSYMMKNQTSLNKEQFGPGTFDIFPILISNPLSYSYADVLGQHNNWREYGQWIYDSFLRDKNIQFTPQLKATLEEYVQGSTDPVEISKAIYKYVQDNTRYVSVSLGDGGLNPADPNKTHETQYSDCKLSLIHI